ncbi:hypothetical protein BJ742DRAFT_794890 [Cladochytrium replicatum]|nr:hypothetical protein BJ742DRAFT_794890 [Cladochytrium replicatum]
MDEAWLREKEDKRRRIDALKTNLGTIKKKTALVFSLIALRTGRIGTLLDRRPKAVGKSAASSLKAPPLERPPWELMREDLVVARSTKKRQLRCDSDPVYRFYNQARFDLRRLVEIRTTWDKYAVPAGSSGATSIPPRWVEPDPPSSDAWAQAVS